MHLSTVHRTSDIRIFLKECRSLAAAGYEVTLIARAETHSTVDGVKIVGLPTPTSRFKRMFVLPWQAIRLTRRENPTLCHFHDTELIPIGILLRIFGVKVVYDVHENLPQDVLHSKPYIPRLFRPLTAFGVDVLERFAGVCLSAIVAVSDGIGSRFPKAKTVIVRNYPILGEVGTAAMPYSQRPNEVVFTGGIDPTRCAREMVDAMELVESEAHLTIAGPTTGLESELEANQGWKRCTYRGFVDRESMHSILAGARIGLLMNYPRADYVDISSNKLYEYMQAGLPVITSDIPSWAKTVREADCGVVIDGTKPSEIAQAIDDLLEHPEKAEAMGRRGQEVARSQYTWDSQKQNLLELYQKLIGRPSCAE